MRLLFLSVIFAILVCACQNPEHAERVLRDMYNTGQITKDQYDALVGALAEGNSAKFWQLLITFGSAVLMSWIGVPKVAALARGPITARKGLPPKSGIA